MTESNAQSSQPSAFRRFSRGAMWLLFAFILLLPKLFALRRRPAVWNALRLFAALAGVGLIAVSAAAHVGWISGAVGALLLLGAALIAPEVRRQSLDERARELGALIVVNGGEYRTPEGSWSQTHLCVGSDRVWVLDTQFAVQCEIGYSAVSDVEVRQSGKDWKLSFISPSVSTDLLYKGHFAEHFARTAESTVRGQLRRALPVLR